MGKHIYNIAVIPGDGIGKEVMPEGLRVLDAAAGRFGIELHYKHIEWASCDYYAATGKMMPDDWKAQLSGMDAIYFGAAGWPATVPDHVSLWGSLLKFRREFDQYVNLRPARLFDGVPCPLANRKPGDIDFMIVRENTEGEYSSVGGIMYEGTEREVVMQQSVHSRIGSDRVLRLRRRVHGSRIATLVTHGGRHVEHRRGAGDDRAHPAFDQVLHLVSEAAHGPAQHDLLRNHVPRVAAVHLRDADDAGIERMQIARDDGLQRADRVSGEEHRILAGIRHCRVRALAGRDDSAVERGHAVDVVAGDNVPQRAHRIRRGRSLGCCA